jgi:hypothetical protein
MGSRKDDRPDRWYQFVLTLGPPFSGSTNEMLEFCSGDYAVYVSVGTLPVTYSDYLQRAALSMDFGIRSDDGTALFFAVQGRTSRWPELAVVMRFEPEPGQGFHPGFLLIPEHHLIFVGAGTRLLAYGLSPLRHLWEDVADVGFWRWRRHGDIVLMSAELEFAAWDIHGGKLWSTFVEPPWSYQVEDGEVTLDVMGSISRFNAATGPMAG